MQCPEDAATAHLRAWGVADDDNLCSNLEDDEGDTASTAAEVVVRDRRNAYSNALKLKALEDINTGVSVTEAARLHGIKSRTAVHAWRGREAIIREACNNKKRSKSSVGGQGRKSLFPHCDELVQWIKEMRRDDFPLKTSHVLVFVKEEYSEFTSVYLAKNKEESLGRMMRRIVYQCGFSFRRPTKAVLSTLDLEAEQRKRASEVGSKVSATYA
ncbi:uncharacterized protein KRP23_3946 [Phytophthora ramorum]|uniref:uncharacterized protein n=1 Tax=Phytophthora ramorum TaxID=164328 RepID=UPI0030AA495E|nr:hypothetical protein KRP23_3946 [Phytophthora ramorum]